MSSCVVDKFAYMKAAGVVAGIAEAYQNDTWKRIHVLDFDTGEVLKPEDFRRCFSACHTMNALSVQERYNDDKPETDDRPYNDEYNTGMRIGRKAAREALYNPAVLLDLTYNLQYFFHHCVYQIDKDAYFYKMKAFFNEIIAEILKTADRDSSRFNKSYDMFQSRPEI